MYKRQLQDLNRWGTNKNMRGLTRVYSASAFFCYVHYTYISTFLAFTYCRWPLRTVIFFGAIATPGPLDSRPSPVCNSCLVLFSLTCSLCDTIMIVGKLHIHSHKVHVSVRCRSCTDLTHSPSLVIFLECSVLEAAS